MLRNQNILEPFAISVIVSLALAVNVLLLG